jgi:hypothetical protein
MLFAAPPVKAAETLNLLDRKHDWANGSHNARQLTLAAAAYGRVRWTQTNLMPWVWRRLRGLSSADGRVPKRPRLEPVGTRCAVHTTT